MEVFGDLKLGETRGGGGALGHGFEFRVSTHTLTQAWQVTSQIATWFRVQVLGFRVQV